MGIETALLVGGGAALAGGLMGKSAATKNAKSAQKAALLEYFEQQANRQKVKDQYTDTRKNWEKYAPQYLEGATAEGNLATSLAQGDSAWQQYLTNEGTGSLGLGYRKATESIMPELYGQTMPIIEDLQEKTLPYARSAAIDQGAYGGARDYLNRERLLEDAEDTVISQGLQDLQNQRAQTAQLLAADSESLNRYLNTALTSSQLQMQSAKDKQYTSDYLWNLATQFGNAVGIGYSPYPSINPSAYGTQGFLNGMGSGISMASSLFGGGFGGNLLGGLFGGGNSGVSSSGGGISSGSANGKYLGSSSWRS